MSFAEAIPTAEECRSFVKKPVLNSIYYSFTSQAFAAIQSNNYNPIIITTRRLLSPEQTAALENVFKSKGFDVKITFPQPQPDDKDQTRTKICVFFS